MAPVTFAEIWSYIFFQSLVIYCVWQWREDKLRSKSSLKLQQTLTYLLLNLFISFVVTNDAMWYELVFINLVIMAFSYWFDCEQNEDNKSAFWWFIFSIGVLLVTDMFVGTSHLMAYFINSPWPRPWW